MSPSAVERLIREFPDCERIILNQVATWEKLKSLDVPEYAPTMDVGFYRALNQMDIRPQKIEAPRFGNTKQMLMRLTVAASLFIGGLIIGKYFMSPEGVESLVEVAESRAPQDYLTYTSATNKAFTATDRLSALHEIKENNNPDKKILAALYQALLNDPNTNVRISAIETLVFFADKPEVRQFLIKAIPHQNSPLVQIALAEATTLLQEKEASNVWRELLSSEAVEPEVKLHLQKTLETIL